MYPLEVYGMYAKLLSHVSGSKLMFVIIFKVREPTATTHHRSHFPEKQTESQPSIVTLVWIVCKFVLILLVGWINIANALKLYNSQQ